MSERRATWLALAIMGGGVLLCYGIVVSEWVLRAAAVVVSAGGGLVLAALVFGALRDALRRRGQPVDDPFADWEAW